MNDSYYPFGMEMPARTFSSPLYRYGFNGKEKDDEAKEEGSQYDYEKRIFDPRVARFYSLDPLQAKFPFYSPYQFAGNTPIQAIDLDGVEEYHYSMVMNNQGKAILSLIEKPKYYNEHSFLWWTWKTEINVKRYKVEYDGKTYYIGYPQYGKGYSNAWSAEEFENNYLKKLGEVIDFENSYIDAGRSQVISDVSTAAHTQNVAAEHSIPMAGGEEELPIQTTRKTATAGKGSATSAKFGGRTIIVDENLSPSIVTKLTGEGYKVKTFAKGTADADILNWAKKNNGAVLTNNIKDFKNQGVMTIEVPVSMSTKGNVDKVINGIKTLNSNMESHGNSVYNNNSTLNLEKDASVIHK